MLKAISASLRSSILTLALAALGVAALGAGGPAGASAAGASCAPGEVCLYSGKNLTGDVYHFSGSDSDLRNDRFEGSFFRTPVANHVQSVWNRGGRDSRGLIDVALFKDPKLRGDAICIPRGRSGDLLINFLNTVESYIWVPRAACNSLPFGLGK